jgi:hypothetical protein
MLLEIVVKNEFIIIINVIKFISIKNICIMIFIKQQLLLQWYNHLFLLFSLIFIKSCKIEIKIISTPRLWCAGLHIVTQSSKKSIEDYSI